MRVTVSGAFARTCGLPGKVEHFTFPKCRFASDDPKAVATWLRENGGYGQPIMHDAGLHVATAAGQYIRSGPALDRWINEALTAPANQ